MFPRLGDVELLLFSEGRTIPWSLVASFAASRFVHTNRGMISTYQVVYVIV